MPMTPSYRAMRVNGVFRARYLDTQHVTADYACPNQDSGKTFFLASNAIDITLPSAPVDGWHCRVIANADYATAPSTVTINGSGEFFAGSIGTATIDTATDGAIFDNAADDVIQFAAAALAGDWVDIVCNGTSWFVSGQSQLAAGIASASS